MPHAAAPAIDIPANVAATAKAQITRATLEAPIRYLADDLLEGRGPASRGDALARLYLATELQSLGYLPGGPDGKWEQPRGHRRHHGAAAQARGASPARAASVDSEAVRGLHRRLRRADAESAGFKDADLVFVGYGIEAPEYQWDDFKGVDVKGKVLVMLNNDPGLGSRSCSPARRACTTAAGPTSTRAPRVMARPA